MLGQLHLGDKVEIDLRLIDARTGELRDATAVAVATQADSPELVAAVLRLDEMAVRADIMGAYVSGRVERVLAIAGAGVILALNVVLLAQTFGVPIPGLG